MKKKFNKPVIRVVHFQIAEKIMGGTELVSGPATNTDTDTTVNIHTSIYEDGVNK